MLAKNLDDLYFSQSALISYQTCPLKFRRRYLDGLFWPADWGGDKNQKEVIEQGRLFHLLAQRYYFLGEVPQSKELLSQQLAFWFEELKKFRPYHDNGKFLPEHEIRMNDNGIKLVAKYDLLYITSDGRVVIYDWKTNNSRPLTNYYRNHLQTITYRYVLAKAGRVYSPTGIFRPEDISVIYWNPRYPNYVEPIGYSQKQFVKDELFLIKLISEIKSLDYDQFIATGDQKRCIYCEYRPICHGKRAIHVEIEEEDMDFDLDWESIEEIQFS
ncbi:hypothetical protein BBF96_08000 [Anoxybacter fermentans]|uniref:PD-(D/E)XK endonuclease-like domain-containing protein n=1 Tax=Anoxybacter fermentans TaxID=1323375 RepID=A0A3S9SYE5_9FIRM|nr:PD-(D/E)XK nuclease family protein [Anoxybacter fermentans]AZR73329.1 hypothetical protein BBF96_08000 [Anoxybacter fermentans]